MTDHARRWFAAFLLPFRTSALHDYLRAVRAGKLSDVFCPLMELTRIAEPLTGGELAYAAYVCTRQANTLTADYSGDRWLRWFDATPTEEAVAAIVAEVEAELARRSDPLNMAGRN